MSMGRFLIRRILMALPVLLLIIFFSFVVIRATPGGPFDMVGSGRRVPESVVNGLNRQYGLNKPILEQFFIYLGNLVQLDFGPSLGRSSLGEPVTEIIARGLPVSMQVGLFSVVLGFSLGIPLGVLAAIYHNTIIDYSATFLAVLGNSIPNLVLGPMLIIIFAVSLNWLPVADVNGVWRSTISNPGVIFTWDYISLAILPVFALGTGMVAGIARLTRASLLQVLREDYIRTARAKGLKERVVIYGHALKNALIPVATILGPLLAGVLTGSFIVEQIFNIPGIGDAFVDSVASRDYNLLVGVTIIYSVFLITGNILVDVMYTWLDPRIRFD
ncbi:MAG: ABC transporter permease [Anaerolineae bacterium]|nr:ABC transporter permease [Anaerolineae bacterium]